MAEAASSQAEAARSAYIHIPFCQQRCFYCDFPIKVVGSSPQDGRARDTIEEYLESLLEEIRRGGGGGFDVEVAAAPLRTVYLGGGTPSLLRPEQVRAVLDAPPPLPPVLTGHVSSLLPY